MEEAERHGGRAERRKEVAAPSGIAFPGIRGPCVPRFLDDQVGLGVARRGVVFHAGLENQINQSVDGLPDNGVVVVGVPCNSHGLVIVALVAEFPISTGAREG